MTFLIKFNSFLLVFYEIQIVLMYFYVSIHVVNLHFRSRIAYNNNNNNNNNNIIIIIIIIK